MLRKNITIKKTDYEIISNFAKKNGYSFSEILRKAALNLIKTEEELGLSEFLNLHLSEIDLKEQKEIDLLNIDFDNVSGKELTLDDIL